MKRSLLILSFLFTLATTVFSQDREQYTATVKEAEMLCKKKDFVSAAAKYNLAFSYVNGKATARDRYNAACAYALSGNTDTAFFHLKKLAAGNGYDNLDHLLADTDLASLHPDKRWKDLTAQVKLNKETSEARLDKKLIAILDTILINDQKYRLQLDELEKKYSWDSKEMQAVYQLMHETDSVNAVVVSRILDEKGWPGTAVGKNGNDAMFFVIQHADINMQLKYIAMVRDAAKKGYVHASEVAMLEDRINVRQGRHQVYGSQLVPHPVTGEPYLFPVTDPDNLDKRRAEVGLGNIASYLKNWNIQWDLEAYKKKLPEYEALMKKGN